MFDWLKAPVMNDEGRQATALFLHRFLVALIVLGVVMLPPLLLFADTPVRSLVMMGLMITASVAQLILLRQGRMRLVCLFLVCASWVFTTTLILTDNGVHSPDATGYVLIVLLAAFLLGDRYGIGVTLLCVASLLCMVVAEQLNWLPAAAPEPNVDWSNFVVLSFFILLAGLLQITLTRILRRSYQARQRTLEAQVATEHRLRETEERLRQSEKMESLGRLAGGVAHDFNNMLQIIVGNAELALKDLKPDSSTAGFLRAITHASENASLLTRQLLTFSRRNISEPKVVDLNQSVRNLQAMLERLLGPSVRLSVVCEPQPACARTDPHQVDEMLVNLSVNARDAMPQGGELVFEIAAVALDEDACARLDAELAPGDYIRLTVRDTGLGMDEAVCAKVFEPFYTTKPSGTGLGLAMVYGAMKQNLGTVEALSTRGSGSAFHLYFPRVHSAPDAAAGMKPQTALPTSQGTVLFVDDNAEVRIVGAEILRRCGYQVLVGASAEEAIRTAEAHAGKIDLLIADVVMPGMNGPDLAKQLNRIQPGTPVLYTSGYDDHVVAHHGFLDPGLTFLAKPYSPTALAQKIREVLDGANP